MQVFQTDFQLVWFSWSVQMEKKDMPRSVWFKGIKHLVNITVDTLAFPLWYVLSYLYVLTYLIF